MRWTKKLEKEFCDKVVAQLPEQRQVDRFLHGRKVHGNNPLKMDYDKEIEQELDDAVIYKLMDNTVQEMFKITKK